MPSTEDRLDAHLRQTLHRVAAAAIEYGLRYHKPPTLRVEDFPERLQAPGASFVTLRRNGELRGCIGSLEAYRPLVLDVSGNGFAAAFNDPRFAPLRPEEFADLGIAISVLGAAEALQFRDEADLLAQLRPGVDGLILRHGGARGTFLPAVWESLPEPKAFLEHLKLKAGLPADYWSPAIRVERYTTESF